MNTVQATHYILTLSCQDRKGLVAAIAQFIFEHDGFVEESHQYGDPDTGLFFMRIQFSLGDGAKSIEAVRKDCTQLAARFELTWELHAVSYRPRVLVLVSKLRHCLSVLINKMEMDQLAIEIPAVVSNHQDLESVAKMHGVPFVHLPVTAEAKSEQEAEILKLVEAYNCDLVVLARYMQILSADFLDRCQVPVINIHHSFLPSFRGAKPYHQAAEHGVKLIGATAHYVTPELDEGPIIEQEVTRVDHTQRPKELVAMGQDVETTVLTRAVKWHTERRIFLNKEKTVIFR